MIQVIYGRIDLIPSYYEALREVAAERVYLEMLEPPTLEKVTEYQSGLISKNGPVFYAIDSHNTVIGWCDIFPNSNPRMSFRGTLGMGIRKDYRGNGTGAILLSATLKKAKEFGLEKVELNVYPTNPGALALYKKMGFKEEGLIKKYRKLDGVYYDSVMMSLFL